jgi:hypothetical protein
MSLSYRIDEEAGILYWEAVGTDTAEEWDETGSQAVGHLNSTPHLNALIDHRQHVPTLPTDYVRKVISSISPPPHGSQPKWALVVQEGVTYGIGRLAASHLEHKGIVAQVFTDYDLAETWLKSDSSR